MAIIRTKYLFFIETKYSFKAERKPPKIINQRPQDGHPERPPKIVSGPPKIAQVNYAKPNPALSVKKKVSATKERAEALQPKDTNVSTKGYSRRAQDSKSKGKKSQIDKNSNKKIVIAQKKGANKTSINPAPLRPISDNSEMLNNKIQQLETSIYGREDAKKEPGPPRINTSVSVFFFQAKTNLDQEKSRDAYFKRWEIEFHL
jgi:hypothetical protein